MLTYLAAIWDQLTDFFRVGLLRLKTYLSFGTPGSERLP
ncbi:hypothetical protein LCGC14_1035690 [marine sediment metagenome]|uniref:Uncharacterized protein n=1 Tax=marine sediment metagenome TaxID=412755 RepID=A0A0F9MXX4_9ZZZZ